jgi:hypothetical protein
MGLELQVIFNREAVMVVPPGINKASGMNQALRKLGMSRHVVVGVGDSENDHSFLSESACAIAVANAVPSILDLADMVTPDENAQGLVAIIDELITNDLARMPGRSKRRPSWFQTSVKNNYLEDHAERIERCQDLQLAEA